MGILKSKIGFTGMSNNGQKMTVVGYRSYHDIDVEFEDGTVVKNKSFCSFKNGTIKNPNKIIQKDSDRIGEVKKANNGQKMTIIEYRNVLDIDIKFEDGTVVKNKQYWNFAAGAVENPNFRKYTRESDLKKKRERVGEEKKSADGFQMKIINYNNATDIDVEFEDGFIKYHTTYHSFKNELIKRHKTYDKNHFKAYSESLPKKYRDKRLGEESVNMDGELLKIIEYHRSDNRSVEFEDGSIVHNKSYYEFQRGLIKNPTKSKYNRCSFVEFICIYYLQRLGFEKKETGFFNKFDERFGNKEIDIFNEDFMIGIEYDGFYFHKDRKEEDLFKNKICRDNNIFLIRIREKGLKSLSDNNCVEVFRKTKNIKDLRNEILKVVSLINEHFFTEFNIDIDIVRDWELIKQEYIKYKNNRYLHRVGEKSITTSGIGMEIIEYFDSSNVLIKFEDGETTTCSYNCFLCGSVKHPLIEPLRKNERLGETNISTNGLKMKIIKYVNVHNITVEFEDGVISENQEYSNFKKGHVKYPYHNLHIGEEKVSSNGLKMKIIDFRSTFDIDVEFEDGVIVKNRTYGNFKQGYIKHPRINANTKNRIGETSIHKNGQLMTIIKYNSVKDIDVEFEDGTILKNRLYSGFKRGILTK